MLSKHGRLLFFINQIRGLGQASNHVKFSTRQGMLGMDFTCKYVDEESISDPTYQLFRHRLYISYCSASMMLVQRGLELVSLS